jgi:hypothetical protein
VHNSASLASRVLQTRAFKGEGRRDWRNTAELVLEAYLVHARTASVALEAAEYNIGRQEHLVNLLLDKTRNRFLKMDVLGTWTGSAFGFGACVVGIFGMNFHTPLFATGLGSDTLADFAVFGTVVFVLFVFFFAVFYLYSKEVCEFGAATVRCMVPAAARPRLGAVGSPSALNLADKAPPSGSSRGTPRSSSKLGSRLLDQASSLASMAGRSASNLVGQSSLPLASNCKTELSSSFGATL